MLRCVAMLIMLLMLGACSSKTPVISKQEIMQKGHELEALTAPKTVSILEESYLGSKLVNLSKEDKNLSRHISVNMTGSLSEVCDLASNLTSSHWYIEDKDSIANHIRYSGTVEDFGHYLAMRYGYAWGYDAETNSFMFSHMVTRTFTLLAAQGAVAYKNTITNASSGSDDKESGTSTSMDTTQNNTASFTVNVWDEAVETIKGLLSKDGKVSANVGAGSVTVMDNARSMRKIEDFIEDFNEKLSRQVALQVRVWQLTIDDSAEIGLNLQAMFDDAGKLALASGAPLAWESLNGGELAATITGGKLKNAQATLKALSTYGKSSLVTSGSGVTMNSQPLPVQNTVKDTYISSMSLNTTDYGQTSEIKPAEVTTGFAMTVIPHILNRRSLILQYNASLTSLDGIRDYSDGSVKVEMPKVSSRAFSQRVSMRMGQTLVLAGFEQEAHSENETLGALQVGRAGNYGRTLIIITISVEEVPTYGGG